MSLPALPTSRAVVETTATDEKCIFHAVVLGHSRQQIINQVGQIMKAWKIETYRMVVGTVIPEGGTIGPPPEKNEPRLYKAAVDVFAFTTDTPTPPAP